MKFLKFHLAHIYKCLLNFIFLIYFINLVVVIVEGKYVIISRELNTC